MKFAKPHFHLSFLIYIPVFLLSAYLVLFQSYWVLKSISVVCFIWLISLIFIILSRLGNKTIGSIVEETVITEQLSVTFKAIRFQLLIFITLVGGLFAIHSFISPQIIIFPRSYAFFIFFSWVIYLLSAAAFASFQSDEKLSFINQCLLPLFQIKFLKKHDVTLKVVNNTYFFQANFIWFSASAALLLFAITHLSGILFHTHIASDFTIRNILIASILFLILSTKGWISFIRENAYEKNFLVLFVSVASFLIVITNFLSWLFYYIGYFFHFSSITTSFSLHDWFYWIDSTTLNQIFIWFWLLGFTPFVALKTVEIYRGFTIRKMLSESSIVPAIVSLILFFAPSFTMIATSLPRQIFALILVALSFSLLIVGFLTQSAFQKIFFSKVTAKDREEFQNVVQSTKGIFQNIVALFILALLFGLLIISIIVPIIFFPIWLLTILLCISIFYEIRQSQLSK